MSFKARITGLGTYLPSQILSNFDLEKMVDTNDEWIVSRSGIRERRIANTEESAATMGALAAKKALQMAAVDSQAIDLILVATMTPDYPMPATACLIQHQIGASTAAAMDISAACTGFIYGLATAKAYIESGLANNILLVATEKMSAVVDYRDRTTCPLFGDGAGAAVIQKEGKGLKIDEVSLGSDGLEAKLLYIPSGGSLNPASALTVEKGEHFLKMTGKEVFKHAVRRMESAAKHCLEKRKISEEEISWLVPHQANIRIIDALAKRFSLPPERIVKTIHKYGNTSASTIPIALAELLLAEPVLEGQLILTVAFGAGLSFGAAILQKI